MLHKIEEYINKHDLIDEKRPILVGLSGGADSVALLAILVRLGYDCIALHCNFHLRGEESMRDELFAKAFAEKLNVPFYKMDFDTKEYAASNHLSIEMAARDLRYAWFREMVKQLGAQGIAVAHHRDDNAETLLINLIRGTGIRGAGGIRPKHNGVIRPLLAIGKEDILDWLADQKLTYVTDSTNKEDDYTRNFIRLNVLPLLEKINPSVKKTLARSAEHLSAVETIYLHSIEKAKENLLETPNQININQLLSCPSPATILYEILYDFNFSRTVSEEVFLSLGKESGKQFFSPTHLLLKDRTHLFLSPIKEEAEKENFVLHSEADFAKLPFVLSIESKIVDKDFKIEKSKNCAYLDKSKVVFPLQIRHWKHGDTFVPFGMKGKKKVSDYFSDRKYSLLQKEKSLLLCNKDHILWIIGERTDNRYRITEQTKEVWILRYHS